MHARTKLFSALIALVLCVSTGGAFAAMAMGAGKDGTLPQTNFTEPLAADDADATDGVEPTDEASDQASSTEATESEDADEGALDEVVADPGESDSALSEEELITAPDSEASDEGEDPSVDAIDSESGEAADGAEEAAETADEWDTFVVDGSLSAEAFAGRADVVDLVVPSSVTAIAPGAFAAMPALRSVDLSATGITALPEGAFADDTALSSVALPDSLGAIGARAFAGCSALRSITIPASVTSIGSGAFLSSVETLTFLTHGSGLSIASDAFTYVRDGGDTQTALGYSDATSVRELETFGHGGFFRFVSLDGEEEVANDSVITVPTTTQPDEKTLRGVQAISIQQKDVDAIARDAYLVYEIPEGMTVTDEPTWEGASGDASVEGDRVVARVDTLNHNDVAALLVPYEADETLAENGGVGISHVYAGDPELSLTSISDAENQIMPVGWQSGNGFRYLVLTVGDTTISDESGEVSATFGQELECKIRLNIDGATLNNVVTQTEGDSGGDPLDASGWSATLNVTITGFSVEERSLSGSSGNPFYDETSGTIKWEFENNYPAANDGNLPTLSFRFVANKSGSVKAKADWSQTKYWYAEGNSYHKTYSAEVEKTANINVATGNLKLTKKVEGESPSSDQEFNFTVTLDKTSINGTYGGMTFANGVANVTLKADESAEATDLPEGARYTITEAKQPGWSVEWENDTGTIGNGANAEATATNTFTPAVVNLEGKKR